jgi:ABC-type nitrate/sulfonate/bicarbonate transport system permease component
LKIADWSSFVGVLTLTAVWQTFTVAFWNANLSFQTALNGVLELLSGDEVWGDIATSLTEIVAGMILGGLIASLTIRLMNRSAKIRNVLIQFLPASYVSPIVVWLLVTFFIVWLDSDHAKVPSFFPGYGHTIMGVGLLTFFSLAQALWGLRHESSRYGILVAIDHALPIAFIAMLFGELYTATAGIGFAMTVASATYQYQKGLAGFLITVGLLVVLSSSLRIVAKRSCL